MINMNFDPTGIAIEIIKSIPSAFRKIREWWSFTVPAGRILGDCINNKTLLKVYVKDLFVPDNTFDHPKLISQEGTVLQTNPNIDKVWPEAESRAVAELFNLLGLLGKRQKIEIVEMSKGYNEWNSNMIVLGAQAMKCREFYEVMINVGYGVDEKNIYDFQTKQPIDMDKRSYGYGIIIKAKNPYNNSKPSFLLGGFGILGTKASVYYFLNNIALLGKEFSNKCFGIVVKARIVAGEQSAVRIKSLDKVF